MLKWLFGRTEQPTDTLTAEEIKALLDKQNLDWWNKQQATQADHERLCEETRRAVEEARKR